MLSVARCPPLSGVPVAGASSQRLQTSVRWRVARAVPSEASLAAVELVEAARFWAKLTKTEMPGKPHHPERIYNYYCVHLRLIPQPAFILDISDVWETRLQAVRCYKSQLFNPDSKEPKTGISSPDFLERLSARFRHYGAEIGAKYGEPYILHRPTPVVDPVAIFRRADG